MFSNYEGSAGNYWLAIFLETVVGSRLEEDVSG